MKFEENETIELKRSTSELKNAVISICAIINQHGKGTVYGVMAGYRWVWDSGWDLALGVGAGMFQPSVGDSQTAILPEVAVGYSF